MLFCMRTTLNLDDKLMRLVKKQAAESGRTVTAVIEEALREAVATPAKAKGKYRLKWVSVRGRLRPGVDLTDRDALYERMEARS
jgi:hypothetical protein